MLFWVISTVAGLGINVDLEEVVLQTRQHLLRKVLTISSIKNELSGLVHTVADHSVCTSIEGPLCLLVEERPGNSKEVRPTPLLDGVLFPAKTTAGWDTLFTP